MSERPVAIGLFREAVVRFGEGKTAMASRLADRARELFLAAGDIDGACAAALLRGRAALRASRYGEATEWLLWARVEANRRGLEPRVLAATSELAVLAELQGDLMSAVAAHRGVLERQRLREDSLGIAMAAGNVARLLPKVAGHLPDIVAESRELLTEALQRFRDGPHEAGIANTLICIGDLDRADGKLDDALGLFQEVVDLPATAGVQPMRLLALHNQGNVLRQMGDYKRALDAYRGAQAMAELLGDVRSARRTAIALAMTQAMTGPLDAAVQVLDGISAVIVASEDQGSHAFLDVNLAQLHAASGRLDVALQHLKDAQRSFTDRGDRTMVEEVELAIAGLSLLTGSDRRAQKQIRRRKGATPAIARERLLLRAQVALRRLDLGDFDVAVTELGAAESWQESVGIGALCVERAAFAGVDSTDALEELAALATRRDARVDYLTLRLAQANAALWLGDFPRAQAWSGEVQEDARRLGRRLVELRARMVFALASGRAVVAATWQRESAALANAKAAIPAAWAGATAALATLDDLAMDVHLRTLEEAGDERHRVFLAAWRAVQGPASYASDAIYYLDTVGLFVPPWLRSASKLPSGPFNADPK